MNDPSAYTVVSAITRVVETPSTATPKPSIKDALSFLQPAQSEDELGRLAHYRVFKVLGSGGMGVVLHGEDINLQRPVALKVIKKEYSRDPETRERFLREARAMAQVNCDHVVTVYQVGEENDTCFIAMELLEGEPLDSYMEAIERPPMREALRITREVAGALASAHRKGVIHRDIKPPNIWIESSGRIKLLDFGLALPDSTDVRLTSTGVVMGTPAYMAPEQARAEATDERCDLFSLGCLLYRLVSGEPPFYGETAMALMISLIESTPEPPSRFNPEISKALDDLILQLLAKTPDGRPRSAQEVVSRIEAIESSLPASSTAQTPKVRRPAFGSFDSDSYSSVSSAFDQSVRSTTSTNQSSVRAREAEHRQVTMLACSCNLFESEDFIDHLDKSEQEELLKIFHETCSNSVQAFEGTIVRWNEESLLMCFGYPIAFEDAVVRATKAALSIVDGLKSVSELIRKERGLELGPWLVLNTGRAIVEAKNEEITVVGEARNIAIRMKEVVGSDQIICSQSTHSLLHGQFECTNLGDHKFKNIKDPVKLFQVHSMLEHSAPAKIANRAKLTPLTGRDLEINLLKARWEQTKEGMGQIVHLIGEAGFGKSRLVHELKNDISETFKEKRPNQKVHDPLVEWYCSPHFQNTGLYPIKTFFQRILRFETGEAPSAQLDRLIKHLDGLKLAQPDTVPLFASLLLLPTDNRFPSISLTPAREREELFRALKDWLRAYAGEHPVLFVIEDLHWIDSSTVEFLSYFLTEGIHDSILTVLTSRPEFQTPWATQSNQNSIALAQLTRTQVGELMCKKTGIKVSQSVVDQVFDRAGGVPLFVEEFTKLVEQTGLLEEVDDGLVKTISRVIPPTLQDLIMARLERLEGDRELAQLAAALGREFKHEVFAAVSGLDEETINSELTKLVQAEILHEKGRRPNSTYIFKNPLLQDALYNALVKIKRQQIHAQIVESLESRFTQMVEPEILAFHAAEANQPEKSVLYWLAAGLRAQELFANADAIGHFKKGLETLALMPESSERDIQELSLLNPLGSAYQAVLGYSAPDVGPTFARARELCQKVGSPQDLFAIMWGNWTWHLVRSELKLCMELADEMIAYAEYNHDDGMIMEAYVAPAVTLYYRGDFKGCRKYCEDAIAHYEDAFQCRKWSNLTGQNAQVVIRCYLALALWHRGHPKEALRLNDEMLAMARQIAHPFSLAHALYFSCLLNFRCRLADVLHEHAKELTELASSQGFDMWRATGIFFQGAAILLCGKEADKALQKIEQGLKEFQALSALLTVPSQLAVLAQACMKSNRLAEANQAINLGLVMAKQNDDGALQAELQRILGELALLDSNDSSTAETRFQQAIETSRTQGSRALELRATIRLAELLKQQNRNDEARAALSTIYGAFAEDCMIPDLVQAKELLAELG